MNSNVLFHLSHVVVVLDPKSHYRHNFSINPEYALALIYAIENMVETPNDDVRTIKEIAANRQCLVRFGQQTTCAGVSSMTPSKY